MFFGDSKKTRVPKKHTKTHNVLKTCGIIVVSRGVAESPHQRKVTIMNYEVNFTDGCENVKVEAYNKTMTTEETVDFINNEATACKMEFVEIYNDDEGEYTDAIVYIWFYNADNTKLVYVIVNNDDENYGFWADMAKKRGVIEGFSIGVDGGTWDKVLKVEKIKVGN